MDTIETAQIMKLPIPTSCNIHDKVEASHITKEYRVLQPPFRLLSPMHILNCPLQLFVTCNHRVDLQF